MHHNKTSQHTIIRTYCHPPANLDNHFAIRKHFCKKNKKRLLFTASSPASIPTTGPGAEPLRGGDKSKSHILSISSSQFSTARRAAAPIRSRPQYPREALCASAPLRVRPKCRSTPKPHAEQHRAAEGFTSACQRQPSAGHKLLPAAYVDAARNRRAHPAAEYVIDRSIRSGSVCLDTIYRIA